ncbi:LamG-like jellyroll fold domain-containing protein [Streptomyces sp. NPDC001312]|uniref:LamG-like jellyroll fold domain-containing protein n=1 Tax=Streptomyces sp. NPDC001312 TaxID=3364561 RepID=UPI00368EA55E
MRRKKPWHALGPGRRRRRVLAAAAAAVGLVGALFAGPAVASPESGSGAAAQGWTPKTPPLKTPWTDQVGPDNAHPEYPRPQLTRKQWQNLNGVWQFAGAQDGDAPPFGKDLDERILVPYPVESALSGIKRHEDRMWYRRTFTVPRNWTAEPGQRLLMHFQAVDYDTKVWVNGHLVATHRGGYDAFTADVTDALKGTGPQEVVVGVTDQTDKTWQPVGKQRNAPDRGIFYTSSSGIWQTVWMEPVSTGHIDALRTTPDIDTGTLFVTPRVTGADGMTVQATAYDGDGAVGTVTGPAGSTLKLPVTHAKLWSPDSPFLYDLRVRLLRGGKPVDDVGSYFGMREIGTAKGSDGRMHITLNGKQTFLMSTLDQGFWPDGIHTAPTDAGLKFDLVEHKRLGFNTVRKHIKVEPDRWYYWADKLGLMVWQDMPSMKVDFSKSRTENTPPEDARQEFERQLHTMVDQHDSWTSIIGWIPFNEGWGEWSREATGRIADDVAKQDPSRLVNAHSGVNCCNSLGDSGKGDVVDFHQYVGPASPVPEGRRVAIDGEHGGFGLQVPGHMWFENGHAYEMEPDSATLTRRYVENQRDLLTAAQQCGVSGGIYTQFTDVEHEVNGFFTYDRQVTKMDFDQVRDINEKVIKGADGSAPPPEYPPGTPGLTGTAAWSMDEGSGTVAEDEVGDHDLTLRQGATWGTGTSGADLQFDGVAGHAETTGPVLDTSGNFTVSAWVKLDRLDGWRTAVGQDGKVQSTFFLQKTGDTNKFSFSTSGGRALSTFSPQTGRWYHLVGVRNAETGEHSLYVDGVKQNSFNQCLNPKSDGPLSVGRARFNSGNVDFWPGGVDQVRVWDRALSSDEISRLYASGK